MSPPDAGGAARRLGRYSLGDLLGSGPSGRVYRAVVRGAAGGQRTFALKVFDPALSGAPDMAARLATAARAYGSLEHPSIARLHEFGIAGGETFAAIDLVAGVDLGRLFAARPAPVFPARAAVSVLARAARAIGYAHGRGILHLGICPGNLIATLDGGVRVTDFGFSVSRLGNRPAEDPALAARAPYLAPEQIAGGNSSPATDVFQLGAIAWEIFTGQPPFAGETAQEVAAAMAAAPPAAPALPASLARVLQRCVSVSPSARFPDASALADALEVAAQDGPLPGRPGDAARIIRSAMGDGDTGTPTLVRAERVRDSAPTLIRPVAAPAATAADARREGREPAGNSTRATGAPALAAARAAVAGGTAISEQGAGRRLAIALLVCVGLGGAGGVAYWTYRRLISPAGAALAAGRSRAEAPAPRDAALSDAAPADAPLASKLVVDTAPKGAKIYLDGAMVGRSPVELDGNSDEHKLAVILPGYKLYTAEVRGRGHVAVHLAAVTPPGGPAGIKVRCHHKNRYYVFVDGYDIGQLCPTERIGVEMGRHVVVIYDPVTDSRRAFHVHVKQTRLSLRVHVD